MQEIEKLKEGMRILNKKLSDMQTKLDDNKQVESTEWKSQSDTVASLHDALCAAQMEMPPLVADSTGYNFKYSDLPAIINHIKSTLGKNGLCYTQEITDISNKTYVITTLRHSSGEWTRAKTPIFFPQRGESTKDYNQECGKAISYMRRYALESILGIKGDDKLDYDRK